MARLMVEGFTTTQTGLCTKEIGKKTSKRELGPKLGLMGAITKENIEMERKMVTEFSLGQMEPLIQGNGNATKCMDLVYSIFQMVGGTKASTLTTRSMAKVSSSTAMEGGRREFGTMGNLFGQTAASLRE